MLNERPDVDTFRTLPLEVPIVDEPEPPQQIECIAPKRQRTAIRRRELAQIRRHRTVLAIRMEHPPHRTRRRRLHPTSHDHPTIVDRGCPPTTRLVKVQSTRRGLATVDSRGVRLSSRNGTTITRTYPDLVAGVRRVLGGRDAILDGEVVALDESGRPSFGLLQRRMHTQRAGAALVREVPARFFVFDVLSADGADVTGLPYTQRRALLDELVTADDPVVQVLPSWTAADGVDGRVMLELAAEHGLEGVVAKRLSSRYRPGERSPDWIKQPLRVSATVVVAGWIGAPGTMESLLLAAVHPSGGLRYIGHVGTGFTRAGREDPCGNSPQSNAPLPRSQVLPRAGRPATTSDGCTQSCSARCTSASSPPVCVTRAGAVYAPTRPLPTRTGRAERPSSGVDVKIVDVPADRDAEVVGRLVADGEADRGGVEEIDSLARGRAHRRPVGGAVQLPDHAAAAAGDGGCGCSGCSAAGGVDAELGGSKGDGAFAPQVMQGVDESGAGLVASSGVRTGDRDPGDGVVALGQRCECFVDEALTVREVVGDGADAHAGRSRGVAHRERPHSPVRDELPHPGEHLYPHTTAGRRSVVHHSVTVSRRSPDPALAGSLRLPNGDWPG